jgi:hypothetical protein
MKKTFQWIMTYFGIVTFVFFLLGLAVPSWWTWVLDKVGGVSVLSVLLGIIMFGMGTTLSHKDFLVVFKHPRDVFLGAVAQYTIMPLLAYSLSRLFQLDPALTAGMVILGTCPGGTTSNVITYMSKGDLAYSVTMTSASTLLAPICTPLLTFLLIGKEIHFDPVAMFVSILEIVILPVALGVLLKTFLPKVTNFAMDYTPGISALTICLILAGVVASSRDALLSHLGLVLVVVMLFNLLGYLLGFVVAKVCGLSWKKAVTLAIEVGMQNSGLATGLAKVHFAAMPAAVIPGALFSVWFNLSGAALAWACINYLNPRFGEEELSVENGNLESAV